MAPTSGPVSSPARMPSHMLSVALKVETGHDAGEGEHRADREVELAGEQEQRHPDRGDQVRRDVAQEIE